MKDYVDHLTPGDLDAVLAEQAGSEVSLHLETCESCQDLLEKERQLVALLTALPDFGPQPGFEDRVMAQVIIPDPFALGLLRKIKDRLTSSRRSLAIAASLAMITIIAMGGSAVWTLSNQETLAALGSGLASEVMQMFWLGVQGLVSNLVEQPWYERARELAGSPARLALVSGFATLLYLGGILALKRLMALPTERVAHAQF